MMWAKKFEGWFANIWSRCEAGVFGLKFSVFGEPQGSGEIWQTEAREPIFHRDGMLIRDDASLIQSRHAQHDHARLSGGSRVRRSGM